jgi:hypothetical protein
MMPAVVVVNNDRPVSRGGGRLWFPTGPGQGVGSEAEQKASRASYASLHSSCLFGRKARTCSASVTGSYEDIHTSGNVAAQHQSGQQKRLFVLCLRRPTTKLKGEVTSWVSGQVNGRRPAAEQEGNVYGRSKGAA